MTLSLSEIILKFIWLRSFISEYFFPIILFISVIVFLSLALCKIVSSPIEETNNLQKPEEINQEQPNIEQKEEMNKVPEVEPIEKYPNDNIKGSKNHLEVQDIMEAKILDIPYKQQKPKESQNINESNPLVNLEPIKETSYSANFNINADLKNESSNVLRTTDLDLYIKKDQEPSQQSQESMDKKQSTKSS